MMMTVKETPKETRVSIYNERNSKSAGRIKGKQPGERSPQSISRTKSKVRDIVACNEFDLAVTLEINPRKVPIAKQEDTLQEIIDYIGPLSGLVTRWWMPYFPPTIRGVLSYAIKTAD